jgi:tellurite resistance protein TehA-like permease
MSGRPPRGPAAAPLATFFPGYFALVMATGIVSLAAHNEGLEVVAGALLWLNVAAYVLLWGLTLARLAWYPRHFVEDLTHHGRGVLFLTKVAATCVLGSQFAAQTPWPGVAVGLWFAGLALWFVLTYTFFSAVTVRHPKPTLQAGINGAWLLVVVAAESVCVLGTAVAARLPRPDVVLFVCLAAYLVGAMLYLPFITLILYRWIFFPLQADELTPPYWINMGALVITTLAGAHLLFAAAGGSFLAALAPFLAGFTLFFWASATWWIPLLLLVGAWRHVYGRVPVAYDPQYWALVFPLGMYAVATFTYARAADLPFLLVVPRVFTYVALAAWAVTFAGLVRRVVDTLRPK